MVLIRRRKDDDPSPLAARRRRRHHRVTISVHLLPTAFVDGSHVGKRDAAAAAAAVAKAPSSGADGPAGSVVVARSSFNVQHTGWHDILLPTTLVQRAVESSSQLLRLRIVCDNCNAATEVVTSSEKKRKSSASPKEKDRKSSTKANRRRSEKPSPMGRRGEGRRRTADEKDRRERHRTPYLVVKAKLKSRA